MFARIPWLRFTPLAVALVAAAPLQACFGKFALVQTLYKVNKDVSDSYVVQEIVFLLFAIFQVYTVVGFIDAFILNPVEIITGENPINLSSLELGERQEIALENGETLILTRLADGMRIEQITADSHRFYTLREGERGLEVVDETGELLAGTLRLDDGSFSVVGADGRVLSQPGTAILAQMGEAIWGGDRSAIVAIGTLETGAETCVAAR